MTYNVDHALSFIIFVKRELVRLQEEVLVCRADVSPKFGSEQRLAS